MTLREDSLIANADAARKRGDLFEAYDLAMAGLEECPDSAGLRYLAVRAMADSGATQNAEDLYEKFGLASHDGVDERSLGARLLKDLAFEEQPAAPEHLLKAAEAYRRVFEQSGHYFPGINAATLFLLAGNQAESERIARALLGDPILQGDTSYYAAATVAEAELLLDLRAAAIQTLGRARKLAGKDFSSIATTRKQLTRILGHRSSNPEGSELLAPLAIPPVAFYCGHMVSGPGGLDEGWQAELRSKLDAAIEQNEIGMAFGGLACGSDILFAEAFLRAGIELNVVLPFKKEDYIKYSVEPGGARWIERFDNCLGRAASVTFASYDGYVGDPCQFTYGSAVAMGMAQLRARHLQTGAIQLAAFDGVSNGGQAGTATDIASWRESGGESVVIEFDRSAAGHKKQQPAIEQWNEAENFPSRQVRSIIFTDAHGFSKIAEIRLPHFWNGIMKRCAATIEGYGGHVLYRNTWGDALYLILDDVSVAADLALSLHNCVTADDAKKLGLASPPQLRVALHHGPLFEGYDPVRKEPTFYGSEVSRTARIEPVTPLGAVYATEPFAAILALRGGSKYSCNYAGRIDLAKGYGAFRMYRLQLASPASASRGRKDK